MNTANITDKAYSGFITIWHKVITFLPDLIVAILFLIVGWFVSSVIKKVINKSLIKIGFNTFLDKLGLNSLLKKIEIDVTGSQVVATIISTFFLLIFLLAALDIIGLTILSGLIDTLVLFFPKLLASLAVLLCGFFVAQIVFNGVKIAAKNTGVDYGRSVAEVCRGIIIIITVSLSITQLDIDVSLLNNIMTVVIASVGLAAAISLGIGTKSMAQEIVAGVYLREMYQVGDTIEVTETKGTLITIGSVASKIMDQTESIVTLPNTFLLANKVVKQ